MTVICHLTSMYVMKSEGIKYWWGSEETGLPVCCWEMWNPTATVQNNMTVPQKQRKSYHMIQQSHLYVRHDIIEENTSACTAIIKEALLAVGGMKRRSNPDTHRHVWCHDWRSKLWAIQTVGCHWVSKVKKLWHTLQQGWPLQRWVRHSQEKASAAVIGLTCCAEDSQAHRGKI